MLAVTDITALVTETNFLDPEYQRVEFEYRSTITSARHVRWVHKTIVLGFLFQNLSLGGKDETRGRVVICTIGMIFVATSRPYRIEIVPLKVLISPTSGPRSRNGIKMSGLSTNATKLIMIDTHVVVRKLCDTLRARSVHAVATAG